jgi:hypothetical protein
VNVFEAYGEKLSDRILQDFSFPLSGSIRAVDWFSSAFFRKALLNKPVNPVSPVGQSLLALNPPTQPTQPTQ